MSRRHSRAVTKLIPGCWYYALRGGATRLIGLMKTHLGNNRLVITMEREMSVGNRNREAPTKANVNIKHERHENVGRERGKRNQKTGTCGSSLTKVLIISGVLHTFPSTARNEGSAALHHGPTLYTLFHQAGAVCGKTCKCANTKSKWRFCFVQC